MPYSKEAKYKHERQRSPKGLGGFYTLPASSSRVKDLLRKPLPKGSKVVIATNPQTNRTVIQSKLIPKKKR